MAYDKAGMVRMTHEDYLQAVRNIAVDRLVNQEHKDLLMGAKLVYGFGHSKNRRGVTCFDHWNTDGKGRELVEICASGEENARQVAGTVLHELAHVLAGTGAGHGKDWKEWCRALGLPGAKAAESVYEKDGMFDEGVLKLIEALGTPDDGIPTTGGHLGAGGAGVMRTGGGACHTGRKAQKGRMKLWVCGCQPKPVKVRVASDEFKAMCMVCGKQFEQHTQQPVEQQTGGDEQ